MPKTVYVPQRRCALLLKPAGNYHNIRRLYTDNFSSCHIIVFIGPKKIALLHLSPQMVFDDLKNLATFMGGDGCAHIFYRNELPALTDGIKTYWQSHLPEFPYVEHSLQNEINGISVSFDPDSNNHFHLQIQFHPISDVPVNMIHHPDEQRFDAVEKIEQLIGMHARIVTEKLRNKKTIIFNGLHWSRIPENEFLIECNDPMTQKEIKEHFTLLPTVALAIRLRNHLCSLAQYNLPIHVTDDMHSTLDVAYYLAGYLNQYNENEIFIRDVKGTIIVFSHSAETQADKEIIEKLNRAINSINPFLSICSSLNSFVATNDFQNNIRIQMNDIITQYNRRLAYRTQETLRKSLSDHASRLAEKAIIHSKNREYPQAISLFEESLSILVECHTPENSDLGTVFYNLGRCLFHLKEYSDAKEYLNLALRIRKKAIPLEKSLIQKTKLVLKECELCDKQDKEMSSTAGSKDSHVIHN